VDAVLSYCHNNLSDNTITDLLPYLESKGVALISASFSSMGLLTQKAGCCLQHSPPPPVPMVLKMQYGNSLCWTGLGGMSWKIGGCTQVHISFHCDLPLLSASCEHHMAQPCRVSSP